MITIARTRDPGRSVAKYSDFDTLYMWVYRSKVFDGTQNLKIRRNDLIKKPTWVPILGPTYSITTPKP